MLNLTAFPLTFSLMPYVAKVVYATDQTGLGYLAAGTAFGALIGSLVLTRHGGAIPAARTMIAFSLVWLGMLLAFSHTQRLATGIPLLMLAGCAQSFSQIPMATMLLKRTDTQYRGRIMGIRMMAIYGNLPGLLVSGPLIVHLGYAWTATLYCLAGIAVTLLIAYRWRHHLWRREAPANASGTLPA